MGASTWLILPTYNEARNLPGLVPAAGRALDAAAPGDHVILIVDDNSPDGTGMVADRLARRHAPAVQVLHRPGKAGLGAAYAAGFHRALQEGAARVVQMDADFSHDPADLTRLLAGIDDGADLVIGSRYVTGGAVENWSAGRRALSRVGCLYARAVLRVPVRDLTSGFKCLRADALRAIDHRTMRANGYAYQVELTHRVLHAGLRVLEIPIVFHERRGGRSEMTPAIALEAAWRVPRLRLDARSSGTPSRDPR